MVLILGIIAALLQLVGYGYYFFYVSKSHIKPNPASWFIWSYGNALVCFSYVFLNDWFLATSIFPVICSAACFVMSFIFLIQGKFRPLEKFEKMIIAFDLVVTFFWVASDFFGKFATIAPSIHVVVLISAIVSFMPIYLELKDDPTSEHSRPWIVWTVAYIFLVATALAAQHTIQAWGYPLLYGILHGVVAYLSSRKKKI